MEQERFTSLVAKELKVDQEAAWKIISAVLQELHDRLTPEEAAHVEAQMPGKIRSLWAGLETPGRVVKRIHKVEFVRAVANLAGISEIDAPHAVRAVFGTLQALLESPTGQEGEAWDIFSQLPKDLKKVWLEAARPQEARRP